jgi:hypothetical protein
MTPDFLPPACRAKALHFDSIDWARFALLLCLLAFWSLGAAQPVSAQEPLPPGDLLIQQLSVQVMPEFDDPRVLVIVQGRLAADNLTFPLTVTFRLPFDAQINQMASVNMATAGSSMQPYIALPDPAGSRWLLVSYSLDGPHFFYEYYYDPITGSLDKEFTFTLSSYHPVEQASVEIQQPKAAEEFRTVPAAASSRLDQNLRLYYHRVEVGALEAGQELSISVSYRKSDPDPSLSWEQVMALQQGLQPPDAATAEPTTPPSFPIPIEILVFLAGAALLLAGAFVGYRLRLADALPAEAGDLSNRFCRFCGTALKAAAHYCHHCGAMALPPSHSLEQATAPSAHPRSHLEVS